MTGCMELVILIATLRWVNQGARPLIVIGNRSRGSGHFWAGINQPQVRQINIPTYTDMDTDCLIHASGVAPSDIDMLTIVDPC